LRGSAGGTGQRRWRKDVTSRRRRGFGLREDCSGERGPDTTERERAHRRVSCAADREVELTVALDGARTRRWPQNAWWSSTGGGRARERASECGRGRKWVRGGGRAGHGAQKGRVRTDVAGERVVMGASTTGDRGREVEDG
jgi:hypothetical protein